VGTREPTGAATEPGRLPAGSDSKTAQPLSRKDLEDLDSETYRALCRIGNLSESWWQQFQVAFTEYGPGAADETGLAGQWADLHRKVKKLRAPMWEGDETRLTRELPREILLDLIGHCFLALDMMDRQLTGGRSSSPSAASSSSSPVSSRSAPESPTSCSNKECIFYGACIYGIHLCTPRILWKRLDRE
jgi:hypothetical protein